MKKAQVQMAESIMTIIILLIILSVGFIFYGRIKEANIGQTQLEYQDLDLVGLSQIIFSLPELQCSFATVKDVGCIDELKFNGTKKLINSDTPEGKQANAYYQSLFGRTKITLLKLHYDQDLNQNTFPKLDEGESDEGVHVKPFTGNQDADGDGLNDGWESEYGITNPSSDFDNDGKTNLEEHNEGTNPISTITSFSDNDNDNLPDEWENRFWNNLNQDYDDDPDNDGKTNLEEYEQGSNPKIANTGLGASTFLLRNPRHIYLYDFSIDNFQSKNTIYMPTIVYNPLNQKQYFGWLQIESFN